MKESDGIEFHPHWETKRAMEWNLEFQFRQIPPVFCIYLNQLLLFVADIIASAVLSGNRNFEGRVHALTRANYLASPPLVVAYALAGTVRIYKPNFTVVIG